MKLAVQGTRRDDPSAFPTGHAGWLGPALRQPAIAAPAHQFEALDSGRLYVNRAFSRFLRHSGLTTFDSLFRLPGGTCVRRVKGRTTTRIVLDVGAGRRSFYLKRHEAPQWGERLRPLLNFGRPILGARNEWLAILGLHDAGVPTLTPVAFGESGGRSLLVTDDLETDCTLLDWVNRLTDGSAARAAAERTSKRAMIRRVAGLARRMHDAGIHHQDFYLNHVLWCGEPARLDVRVIDPGRARKLASLSRRWIIKDLAQLNFSARRMSCADRLRFLRLYLDRPFRRSDRCLVGLIALKSRRIAGHTGKHRL